MSDQRDAAARPLVYVAGPITADPWGCVRKATDAARVLHDLGAHAYLPQLSVLHEMVEPQPYDYWLDHGITMLVRCDGVVRLPGESFGADSEMAVALERGIPTFFAGGDLVPDMMRYWVQSLQRARSGRSMFREPSS